MKNKFLYLIPMIATILLIPLSGIEYAEATSDEEKKLEKKLKKVKKNLKKIEKKIASLEGSTDPADIKKLKELSDKRDKKQNKLNKIQKKLAELAKPVASPPTFEIPTQYTVYDAPVTVEDTAKLTELYEKLAGLQGKLSSGNLNEAQKAETISEIKNVKKTIYLISAGSFALGEEDKAIEDKKKKIHERLDEIQNERIKLAEPFADRAGQMTCEDSPETMAFCQADAKLRAEAYTLLVTVWDLQKQQQNNANIQIQIMANIPEF